MKRVGIVLSVTRFLGFGVFLLLSVLLFLLAMPSAFYETFNNFLKEWPFWTNLLLWLLCFFVIVPLLERLFNFVTVPLTKKLFDAPDKRNADRWYQGKTTPLD